jgi:hypothetical protein
MGGASQPLHANGGPWVNGLMAEEKSLRKALRLG